MSNLKIDFHAHLTDHQDIIWNKKLPIIGGSYFPGLFNNGSYLALRVLINNGLFSKNTLLGVINFDDHRAESLFESIKKELENQRVINDQRGIHPRESMEHFQDGNFLTVSGIENTMHFWAGTEYRTPNGDVLVLGMTDDLKRRDLDYIVKTAKNMRDTLVLIPHAGKYGAIGVSEKAIEKVRDYIDGVDSREISKRLNLPFYSASDSHTLKGTFQNHMIYNDESTNPEYSLQYSIKRALKSGDLIAVEKDRPLIEDLRHVSSIALALAGLKTGILRRDH